ncbi:CPBP family intramembrane glutamic endopeptidase [Glaciimonas soli]|uniref:CPBP family intramembrane metalloprotease n=1 Tax=Glaciimonas soli TaxID=2590999 RepID=A0A843YU94_9BURK|nr:CPBP family intramembrane glutamic endopeptidase [Glaciimonas soli]MQR00901.1 CPBP family intramembrane metalloprotease [Glaciimonas soli]
MTSISTRRWPLTTTGMLEYWVKTPAWKLIPLALLALFTVPIPVALLFALFFPDIHIGSPDVAKHGVILEIVMACIVAPLYETSVFQWLCINLLRKIPGCSAIVAVVISAGLFAASHYYSIFYVVIVFPAGLVLGGVYVLEKAKGGSPFWMVVTLHALKNAIVFLYTMHLL